MSRWPYFETLLFLTDTVRDRQSASNCCIFTCIYFSSELSRILRSRQKKTCKGISGTPVLHLIMVGTVCNVVCFLNCSTLDQEGEGTALPTSFPPPSSSSASVESQPGPFRYSSPLSLQPQKRKRVETMKEEAYRVLIQSLQECGREAEPERRYGHKLWTRGCKPPEKTLD